MFTPLTDDEDRCLSIYVLGSKAVPHQKAEKYPGGFVRCCQFSLFTGGRGSFTDHNKKKWRIHPGDVFYFTEGTPVEYYPFSDRWETVYVMCAGSGLGTLMDYLGFSQSGVITTTNTGVFDEVRTLFEEIVELNKLRGRLVNSELSYLLYELLMTLGECNGAMPNEDPAVKRLEPLVKMIDERYHEDIPLEEMADIVGCTPSYLGKLFREVYHTSPVTYLIRVRVEQARKLLCSDLSLTTQQVGERCGFNDKSYFGKIFKRYTGITPAEYRAANTYIENNRGNKDAVTDQ